MKILLTDTKVSNLKFIFADYFVKISHMNIIYLIIHILFALGMFISLKIIDTKQLNKYQAITVNYIVALILTVLSTGGEIAGEVDNMGTGMFLASLWVGFLFILSFVLMSFSTERAGIGLTTALNKMSVVIPVTVGILYLGQDDNITEKIFGIILALISFVLILYKSKNEKVSLLTLALPVSVFVISGLIDTSMEITNKKILSEDSHQELFLSGIFATASLIGLVTIIFDKIKRKSAHTFESKNILWGAVMGTFNFLVSKMILVNVGLMGGSVVFPVHNASVVMLTALAGMLFFKERFTVKQWIGVVLAVISVIIIAGTI